MNLLKQICSIGFLRKTIEQIYTPSTPKNTVDYFGLQFRNKIGLGAGFDKNALYLRELKALGFGFVEIGTVTPLPQIGNETPRLFRLPADKALINRMGFNNDGVEAIKNRLIQWQATNTDKTFIVGGNIGKNKQTSNEDAWKDYLICFEQLHNVVDYFVVNVSSPNTPGLRALQEKPMLTTIFNALQQFNKSQTTYKPVLLKIAPDLSEPELDDIIELAQEQQLDGLVISNTTISRANLFTNQETVTSIGAGGVSGKPVLAKSNEVLQYVSSKTNGQLCIIGSGGIFTKQDATAKLNHGANLLQVWTGFVYQGPAIVKQLNE